MNGVTDSDAIELRELPEDWYWADLGGISLARLGKTPRKKDYRDEGVHKIIKFRDVKDGGEINWSKEDKGYVDASEEVIRGLKDLVAGDVLVTASAHMSEHIGRKVGLVSSVPSEYEKAYVVGEILQIRVGDDLLPKWVMYFLQSSEGYKAIQRRVHGVHLTGGRAQKIEVPIAPAEQQALVIAEIEKQFSRLDEAVASLKRVKANLKRYKAAVLKAAVEGKLTEEWRNQNPDVEPASKLLERFSSDDKQDGLRIDPQPRQFDSLLPGSWAYVSLDQLLDYTTSGSRGWAKYYSEDGDIFIRAQNINRDILNFSDVAFVSLPEKVEGKRTRVRFGDLLITITGANVTKSALVDTEIDRNAYISQHVALVRPLSSEFSKYLYLFIVSPSHGRRQLEKAAYGAGKPGLNLTNIRELGVAFPPLLEQEEIVLAVDAALSKIDSIEIAIVKQERRISAARVSILKQAFSGVFSIIADAA